MTACRYPTLLRPPERRQSPERHNLDEITRFAAGRVPVKARDAAVIASMALDKLRSLDSRPYVHMVKAQTLAQQLALSLIHI